LLFLLTWSYAPCWECLPRECIMHSHLGLLSLASMPLIEMNVEN
jgi:hypothetical protein